MADVRTGEIIQYQNVPAMQVYRHIGILILPSAAMTSTAVLRCVQLQAREECAQSDLDALTGVKARSDRKVHNHGNP